MSGEWKSTNGDAVERKTEDGMGGLASPTVYPLSVSNGGTGSSTTGGAWENLSGSSNWGDLIYGQSGGNPTVLPIGTPGQVLTVQNAGNPPNQPEWSTPASSGGTVTSVGTSSSATGFTLGGGPITTSGTIALSIPVPATAYNALTPMTTKGDLVYESATGVASRLPIGTTNQMLSVSSGVPAWTASSSSTLTTQGDMLYENSGSLARLAVGTANQAMFSSGTAPEWGTLPVGGGGTGQTTAGGAWSALSLETTAGDMTYATTAGAPVRLPIGTASQAMFTNSGATAPQWGTLPAAGGGTALTTQPTAQAASTYAAWDANSRMLSQGEYKQVANTLTSYSGITISASGTRIYTATSGGTLSFPATCPAGYVYTIINNTSGPGGAIIVQASGGAGNTIQTLQIGEGGVFICNTANATTAAGWSSWVFSYNGGVVAVARGGTGQTTAALAWSALSLETTAGDMTYATTAGAPVRLPIGSTSQMLSVVAGVPAWTASSSSTLTTQGDMLYEGSSALARLAIGTANQALFVNSGATAPQWGTLPVGGGGTGQTTAALAWAALSLQANAGDMTYATTAGAPVDLPIGVAGTVLVSTGSAPYWNTFAPNGTQLIYTANSSSEYGPVTSGYTLFITGSQTSVQVNLSDAVNTTQEIMNATTNCTVNVWSKYSSGLLLSLAPGTTGRFWCPYASYATADYTWAWYPNGSTNETAGGTTVLPLTQGGTGGSTAALGWAALSLQTTAGDLTYATTAGAPVRLPIGTANQAMFVNSGATAPQWGILPVAGGGIGSSTGPLFPWGPGISTATATLTSASNYHQVFEYAGSGTITMPTGLNNLQFKIWNITAYQVVIKSNSGVTMLTMNAYQTAFFLCTGTGTGVTPWLWEIGFEGDSTLGQTTGVLNINNGGTGTTSATVATTALAYAGWDSNGNLNANNFITGATTWPNSSGNYTIISSTCAVVQVVGTSGQINVTLLASPQVGRDYTIMNDSSNLVVVYNSSTIVSILATGQSARFICYDAAPLWDQVTMNTGPQYYVIYVNLPTAGNVYTAVPRNPLTPYYLLTPTTGSVFSIVFTSFSPNSIVIDNSNGQSSGGCTLQLPLYSTISYGIQYNITYYGTVLSALQISNYGGTGLVTLQGTTGKIGAVNLVMTLIDTGGTAYWGWVYTGTNSGIGTAAA